MINYRDVNPLQGNLKDLDEKNYEKLKIILESRGFTTPLFLWQDKQEFYLLDGHQRQIVMNQEDMNDNGSYEVPYILIDAKDMADAKAMLLEITSQFGRITYEGYDQFVEEAQLPEAEMLEKINYDALPLLTREPANENSKKRQLLTCPECQFEGEMKDYKRRYEPKLGEV